MDRLLQMIINAVLRQLVNRGVRSGIDYATRSGKPLSPDDRAQSQDAKAIARRARQAANLARRLGR
jgi:hypothetical protein